MEMAMNSWETGGILIHKDIPAHLYYTRHRWDRLCEFGAIYILSVPITDDPEPEFGG